MFRFFRKLRSTALMNNRFVKYSFYALGEIALVVIGILIALYLDGQKDYREDRRQERAYLTELRRDMERNLQELDRVIHKSGNILLACDSVIAYSQRDPATIQDTMLLGYMEELMGYTKHMTQQGTIEDLLGSGNLGVIRNDSVRRAVATWEADLKLMRELEADGKVSFEKLVAYFSEHIPMYKQPDMDQVKTDLLQQLLFRNRVADRGIVMDFLYETYEAIQPRWQRLLKLVEAELQEWDRTAEGADPTLISP